MLKNMNVVSLLNRTDDTYFTISPERSKYLIKEGSIISWDMKNRNAAMIAQLARTGLKRRVFLLIMEKRAYYTIGLLYPSSEITMVSSTYADIVGISIPDTLLCVMFLSQYHTYRYAANLA